jgi:hypothetical protein
MFLPPAKLLDSDATFVVVAEPVSAPKATSSDREHLG